MLFDARQTRSGAPAVREVPLEARREAVSKVLSSAVLEKCSRLRELLSYVAEHSYSQPDVQIPEQQIGIDVFGRKDYDASEDNLVRVQATHLRKKLEQYFSTEGIDDAVAFEIPRGNYALRFRFQNARPCTPVATAGVRRRRYLIASAILAGLALAAAGWFARGLALEAQVTQPTVRKLWTQFFANGRETHMVLADANLTGVQDFLKQSLVLRQYNRASFMRDLVNGRFQDPEFRKLTLRLAGKHWVSFADATAAREIEALGFVPGSRTQYDFARGFSVEDLMEDNAVLLGNKRANPWVELFDPQLRFRYVFDDEKTESRFEDTQAGPGAPRLYPTNWDQNSHCQVAMLPNLRRTGSVLIIAGGDQSAAGAGSEFLTSERWVLELARRLGVSPDQPFPHFEAFLKTETMSNTASSFRLISCRAIK
ncbi:MAG TPA: hypothetical protein VN428_00865 [Bryobacteraceae bacterium]|nr:hypothetical protein [Bryobacteraceae bacterium]